MFLIEGRAAAVDHDDFAFDRFGVIGQQVLVAGVGAGVLEEEVFIFRALAGGVQRFDDGGVGIFGFREERDFAVNAQVVAGLTDVVDGGDCQRVGVAARGADGVKADVVGVEVADAACCAVSPGTGVAGGDADDCARFRQVVQDGLVFSVGAGAGVGRTQGQVDAVAAQNDCIFDGCHVVRRVSAAGLAEDLHGDQLCIRCNALCMDAFKGCNKAALAVRDVAVGCGDTGNVRAVFAGFVVVVREVEIFVNVVVAERQLGIDVELFRRDALCALRNVQLAEDFFDIRCGHQVDFFACRFVFGDGIFKRFRVEALMVRIRTGVDDGNLAADAIVAGCPCKAAADHFAGGRHVRVDRFNTGHHRIIAVFHNDGFNAFDSFDGFNAAVGDVRRNEVGCKGQIPDDVQVFAAQGFFGNLLSQRILPSLQVLPVGDCLAVFCNVLNGETLLNGRFLLQDNGHTNDIRILVERCRFIRVDCNAVTQRSRHCVVVDLSDPDVGCGICVCRADRYSKTQAHCQSQHKRDQAFAEVLLHMHSPFLYLRWNDSLHLFTGQAPRCTN